MKPILTPEILRQDYQRFLNHEDRSQRILLTGHSHQAWPDVAEEGVRQAFADAALHVDDKWTEVFRRAHRVQKAIVESVGGVADEIALGQNTHELFTRFLSALPLRSRPLLIASDGEFHSVYRQLTALSEAGVIEVLWVNSDEHATLAGRMSDTLKANANRCAAVVTSSVLFQTGAVVAGLDELASACLHAGARLFVDAYHSFQVVPFHLDRLGEGASITYLSGGGYKYAQWGEGACWLRVPQEDDLKPLFTGWFSAFEHLHEPRYDFAGGARPIQYGSTPAARFAGSTFDPTSLYRAARVADFFDERGLEVHALRAISLRQTQRLLQGLSDIFKPITPIDERRGGFIAFEVPFAHEWVLRLRQEGIFVDARGDALRFGPAPYLTDAELDRAIDLTLQLNTKIKDQ